MGFVIYILLLIFDYFLIMLFTDTASQERFWSENFRNVNESLFRGADIIIVGYDITDRHSLYRCEDWIELYSKHSNGVLVAVGNKINLRNTKYETVSKEEAIEFFDKHGIPLLL